MRLIDLDSLIAEFNKRCRGECCCCTEDYCGSGNEGCGCRVIDEAPTVDAVEVVRCKDCYYCVTEKSFGKKYLLYCDAFYEHAEGDLIGVSLMVEPNHFCSWGERRKDGKTN